MWRVLAWNAARPGAPALWAGAARGAARRRPPAPLAGSRSEVLVHDRNASAGFGLAAPRARARTVPLPYALAPPPFALARVGDRRHRCGAPRHRTADRSIENHELVCRDRAALRTRRRDARQRGAVGGPQDARAARDASGARRPVAELRALADPRRRRRAGLARRAGQPRCEARAAAGARGAPHARRKARGVGRARRRLADRGAYRPGRVRRRHRRLNPRQGVGRIRTAIAHQSPTHHRMTNGSQTMLNHKRRSFLSASAATTLSAAAFGLIAARDVDILNVALGLEHEAINAYQLGAQSGLLQKPVLDAAVLFQSHHKGHRDALMATIEKLGGRPVAEKPMAEYARALNAGAIKSQEDILNLAVRLELGASNAYLGVIPSFQDANLAKVAARLAADETMHWTALSGVLGRQLPGAPLSFGA